MEESRDRKCGFEVKFEGVGGRDVQVPREMCGSGGVVGSRERRC